MRIVSTINSLDRFLFEDIQSFYGGVSHGNEGLNEEDQRILGIAHYERLERNVSRR